MPVPREEDVSGGRDGVQELWMVTQSRVNLNMVHRAGWEGEEQCPRGRLRKDEDQPLRFPATPQEVTRKADPHVTDHRGSQEREAGERRQKAQWGQGREDGSARGPLEPEGPH